MAKTKPLKWWLTVWEKHPTVEGMGKKWYEEKFTTEEIATLALPRVLRAIENAAPGTKTTHTIVRR